MYQPCAVRGGESLRNLLYVVHAASRIERLTALSQDVGQIPTLDQTHVEVKPAINLAVTMYRNHMGVSQTGCGVRLTAKAFLELRVVARLGGQHLERYHAVGRIVVGAVNLAHAPLTEQLH